MGVHLGMPAAWIYVLRGMPDAHADFHSGYIWKSSQKFVTGQILLN
jgi:hypothetical protein